MLLCFLHEFRGSYKCRFIKPIASESWRDLHTRFWPDSVDFGSELAQLGRHSWQRGLTLWVDMYNIGLPQVLGPYKAGSLQDTANLFASPLSGWLLSTINKSMPKYWNYYLKEINIYSDCIHYFLHFRVHLFYFLCFCPFIYNFLILAFLVLNRPINLQDYISQVLLLKCHPCPLACVLCVYCIKIWCIIWSEADWQKRCQLLPLPHPPAIARPGRTGVVSNPGPR